MRDFFCALTLIATCVITALFWLMVLSIFTCRLWEAFFI